MQLKLVEFRCVRLARQVTGRSIVLVYDYCYHGTVDEAFATLGAEAEVRARDGNIGPPVDPSATTRVVEWNDVAALEAALADSRVAAVLAEPNDEGLNFVILLIVVFD